MRLQLNWNQTSVCPARLKIKFPAKFSNDRKLIRGEVTRYRILRHFCYINSFIPFYVFYPFTMGQTMVDDKEKQEQKYSRHER